MEPPLSPCPRGCTRNVILARYDHGELPLETAPTPDGPFVLYGQQPVGMSMQVNARPFELTEHAQRRRWSPHVCPPEVFVAIDFETADGARDSACAVGLVRVEGDRITRSASFRVRPPRERFTNTEIHGLSWDDCKTAGDLSAVWREASPLLTGADYFVAHNAVFDRSVLQNSLGTYGVSAPAMPWVCTLRLARQSWQLKSYRLPDVSSYLGLDLVQHHDALHDATACAGILLAARALAREKNGWDWRRFID